MGPIRATEIGECQPIRAADSDRPRPEGGAGAGGGRGHSTVGTAQGALVSLVRRRAGGRS